MAQLPNGPFDATTVDPAGPVGADPDFVGWHPAVVIESEMRATKASGGQYLEAKFEVISGPFKGRNLWHRMNLVNKSQVAMEIGYRELSAIGHAVGVVHIADTQQLHNRPLMVNVEYEPAGTGSNEKARNNVVGFAAMDTNAGTAPPPAATAVPPAAPAVPAGAPPAGGQPAEAVAAQAGMWPNQAPGAAAPTAAPKSAPPWAKKAS